MLALPLVLGVASCNKHPGVPADAQKTADVLTGDGGQQSIIDVETRMMVQAVPVSASPPPSPPPFSPGMNRSDASVTVDYALAK